MPARRVFLLASLTWSAFCLWLAADGQSPSFTLLPVPNAHYYLFQAVVLPAVLWMLLRLHAAVIAHCAGLGTPLSSRTADALSVSVSGPLWLLWLVPELVTYALFGFEALSAVVRFAAPLTFLLSTAVAARHLHLHEARSVPRATLCAALGLLVLGIAAGPVLR